MANTSVLTQADALDIYNNKIKPYLNGASHNGCLPVGTIISVFDEVAPNHFLICDGTTYNKADYPILAAKLLSLTDHSAYEVSGDDTKFKVPDLRGEFLRGTGTNGHTNQGNGASVGTHQDATEFPSIEINGSTIYYLKSNIGSSWTKVYNNIDSNVSAASMDNFNNSGNYGTGSSGSMKTSRPTNTSVLYCIAYENVYVDVSVGGFPVDLDTPTDGQVLTYDATNNEWTNANATGGHTITDETTTYTQREVMEFAAPLTVEDDDTSGSEKTIIGVDDTGELDLSKFVAPSTTKEDWEHIYSTSEQVVGKWIDGKPIYEKTFSYTLTEQWNVGSHNISASIPNFKRCYKCEAMYQGPVDSSIAIPFGNASSEYGAVYIGVIDGTNIQVRVGGSQYLPVGASVTVIIQYTKTTDTATI